MVDNVAHLSGVDLARAIDRRRLDEVHGCVAPSCSRRAREAFAAAEDGRLGGREWRRGDLIDLCPGHAHDVRAAVGVVDRRQLALWLQADARPDPVELLFGVLDGLG